MEPSGTTYSINPIAGNLNFEQARHLLDRSLFGAKLSEIESISGKTIGEALKILTAVQVTPPDPVSMDARDLNAGLGETWVNAAYNSTYNSYRLKSLRSWWIGNMMQQGISLSEKMVLFWHNHFVTETSVVSNASYLYKYNQLLRKYALGNIKQLMTEMTVSPAMLDYLNGDENKASAPNENFARELFELFSIGKGPLLADGNYTNYTESDIREAAKVLTGWKNDRNNSVSVYDTSRHDKTIKTFSEALGSVSIQNKEAEEYKLLIDLIFSKKETARNFARKIYRWFMYYNISSEVEENIIEPMATSLFSNNYEIKPMLELLLSSQHFFSTDFFGSQIKNPLDFTIGIYRKCNIDLSTAMLTNYEIWNAIYTSCQTMEMSLGDPPDVAGWPQYYSSPLYYGLWINTATIPNRTAFTDTLCKNGITKFGFKYIIDPFILTSWISDPANPDSLLNGYARILLPVSLNENQLKLLKEELIPGLPDSSWTYEWNKYATNPADSAQKSLISKKLLAVLSSILRLPEFYLC